MSILKKCTFEELLGSVSHFLDFPDIEEEIENLIQVEILNTMLAQTHNGDRPEIDVLSDYLEKSVDTLALIARMSGGSLEKLKRIVASIFGVSLNKVLKEEHMRRRLAAFLINPDSEQSFIPQFIRNSFCLPDGWIDLLKREDYLSSIARDQMSSKYSARMGFKFEDIVSSKVERLGYSCQKGPVSVVDNKEIDIAIESTSSPRLLVMASYLLTTSSGQTSKANEQTRMYSCVQDRNRSRQRSSDNLVFVNVVDGGGWLARNRDLEQLWLNCDYCFTYKSLDDFEELVERTLRG